MNPARTLAERFRTQRTDRIRVDGIEVLSMLEIPLDSETAIEVVVEQCRADVIEALVLDCAEAPFYLMRTSPPDAVPIERFGIPVDELTFAAAADSVFEGVIEAFEPVTVRLWNAWMLEGTRHEWLGNCGLIVEDLEVPDGALRRHRLWCSDGLGNASFDDLVVVVTLAPAIGDEDDSRWGWPPGEEE